MFLFSSGIQSFSNKIHSTHFIYGYMASDRITHTTTSLTPVMEHWLEQEIAQWVQPISNKKTKQA